MSPQPPKPRVLVVDDNVANQLAYRTVLEDRYTVYLAGTGLEALSLALKHEFAVVLLDVRMPGMNGFETAAWLRKSDRSRFTPIIFLTAFEKASSEVAKGYLAGATDYLVTPIEPDFLRYKVAAFVEQYLYNETLRVEISQLNQLVHSMREEARHKRPDTGFIRKLGDVDTLVQRLRQDLTLPG